MKSETVLLFAAITLMASRAVGAPEGLVNDRFNAKARSHWAFQKVSRPIPPLVKQTKWVRNPIDAFVLSGLEARKLAPSAPADKATLLRRAYLDLLGLPPGPN